VENNLRLAAPAFAPSGPKGSNAPLRRNQGKRSMHWKLMQVPMLAPPGVLSSEAGYAKDAILARDGSMLFRLLLRSF